MQTAEEPDFLGATRQIMRGISGNTTPTTTIILANNHHHDHHSKYIPYPGHLHIFYSPHKNIPTTAKIATASVHFPIPNTNYD